jgi:hypothetical protein
MGNKSEAVVAVSMIIISLAAIFISFAVGLAFVVGILMGIGYYVFHVQYTVNDWMFWTLLPAVIMTVFYGVVFKLILDS